MRRKDRETGREAALAVVDKCEYAVLAMAAEDGTPYCVPLSIVRVGEDIYFHAAKEGRKTDFLRTNPRVCLSCVGDTRRMQDKFTTEYESAIVFGAAEEVTEDVDKTSALKALCERHTPGNMAAFEDAVAQSLWRTAVWRVQIEKITGKRKKYGAYGTERKADGA